MHAAFRLILSTLTDLVVSFTNVVNRCCSQKWYIQYRIKALVMGTIFMKNVCIKNLFKMELLLQLKL